MWIERSFLEDEDFCIGLRSEIAFAEAVDDAVRCGLLILSHYEEYLHRWHQDSSSLYCAYSCLRRRIRASLFHLNSAISDIKQGRFLKLACNNILSIWKMPPSSMMTYSSVYPRSNHANCRIGCQKPVDDFVKNVSPAPPNFLRLRFRMRHKGYWISVQ
jgi:hypothetical protein